MTFTAHHSEHGTRLIDKDGCLRGVVLEEKIGRNTIWSWTYFKPDQIGLASTAVNRGSEPHPDAAFHAIMQCARKG